MKSITVDATPEDCYRAWRDMERYPDFLSFVESVRPHGETRTHWVVRDGDDTVEWDVDLVEDRPNRSMVWRSIPGSDIELVGVVQFEPATGGRGTIVRLGLEYSAQKTFAKHELHRFKQWFETGEIARTEGQPSGPRGMIGRKLRKGERS